VEARWVGRPGRRKEEWKRGIPILAPISRRLRSEAVLREAD
jgi:hypothetical protein